MAYASRSETASVRAASPGRCEAYRSSLTWREQMDRHCPQALLVNVSNPLTALCRAASRESSVRVVGLCNELVGLKFSMSLLFDAPDAQGRSGIGRGQPLPLVTELRIDGADGFAMLRSLLEAPDVHGGEPLWMDPVEGMHWQKASEGERWTKADVVANNRLKLELFRRFGVLPGASDTHVAEFLPGFVTAASDFGREWGVHHYGLSGHQQDKADRRSRSGRTSRRRRDLAVALWRACGRAARRNRRRHQTRPAR